MSRDVQQVLKYYIKIFRTKGASRIRGENISVALKQLEAVVVRLDKVGDILDETVSDLLEGLTICSVKAFKKVFDHLLQQKRLPCYNSPLPSHQPSNE